MAQIHSINGIILIPKTKKGISKLTIEAWEQDVKVSDLIGKVITDINGRFTITFDESHWKDNTQDKYPIVFFRVFDTSGNLLRDTRGEIFWTEKQGTNEIIIPVGTSTALPSSTMKKSINGKLLNEWSRGIADASVKLSQLTGPGEIQRQAIRIITK